MNGLSSVLLIITCTNVDLFLIVPLDTNFGEILIKIQTLSLIEPFNVILPFPRGYISQGPKRKQKLIINHWANQGTKWQNPS